MSYLSIYLFTRLGSVSHLLSGMLFISIIVMTLGLILTIVLYTTANDYTGASYNADEVKADMYMKHFNKTLKAFKASIIVVISLAIFKVAIPTQGEMAAIYLIPKIVNSESVDEVSKMPKKVLHIMNIKMEKWLEAAVGDSVENVKKVVDKSVDKVNKVVGE